MLPNDNPQLGDDFDLPELEEECPIEALARKIIQVTPGLGWHRAWIKAVRLSRSV